MTERAREDGIPDSRVTSSLIQEIASFDDQLQDLQRRLSVPHDDWRQVHDSALEMHRQLSAAAGRLGGELQIAEQAAESLESAAQQVFQAAQWTGGLGVRILGAPGSRELDRAREALQKANYTAALELSRASALMAGQAILKRNARSCATTKGAAKTGRGGSSTSSAIV